jgi:predicted nucleic acid-binding protein
MSNLILIDTSFLYALYNTDDEYHSIAVEYAREINKTSVVPEVILIEITFLFMRDIGYHAIPPFLQKLDESNIQLQCLEWADIRRAQEIMATYASSEFDLVDACIMALSERLQITHVCTFDRRDFGIFRPTHCDYLELMP